MIQRNIQQQALNLFQIPDLPDHGTTLIGILDASGSMKSKWPFLVKHYNELKNKMKQSWTITFDSRPFFCFQKDLQEDLQLYGGGETNIVSAFQHLNDLLEFIPQKENITVLFVSDGKDSVGGIEQRLLTLKPVKVKNLNFICLGIGNDFPTFIAMKLRAIYHTGDQSVLPLFLIKGEGTKPKTQEEMIVAIDKVFKKEFQNITDQCRHKKLIEVSPILTFPWEEQLSTQAWSGSWVLSEENNEILVENFNKLQPSILNRAQILQIGQYWLKQLQLMGLQRSVIKQARMTLRMFNILVNKTRCTFAERVTTQEDILNIQSELSLMAEEDVLIKLNEEQAAQRMLIGTKVGKFYKKIMKKNVISTGEFELYRNTFILSLQKNQFLDTETERSVITLQNQKEILQEQDLIQGLTICPTQYHLVISFPVIGYGLKVYRSDSVQVDPYQIDVLEIAKHHKYIDSTTIIQSPNQELTLSVGDGEQETINCILPLYRKADTDLYPFLKSKVFEVLMTYMVTKNADAILDTAYNALLSNTLFYLLKLDKSHYQQELINLIIESYELVFTKNERYQYFTEILLEFPREAVVDFNSLKNTKCEDLTKPLLILEQQKKNLKPEYLKTILDFIIMEAFGRQLKYITQDKFYEIFLAIQNNMNQFNQELAQRVGFTFNPDIYGKDKFDAKFLRKAIESEVAESYKQHQAAIHLQFSIDKLKAALYKTKYSLEALQKIYNYFLGIDMDINFLIICVFHARIQNSLERSLGPINDNANRIMNDIIMPLYVKECVISVAYPMALIIVKERFPNLFSAPRQNFGNQDFNQERVFHSNPPGQGKGRRRRRRPKRKFILQ